MFIGKNNAYCLFGNIFGDSIDSKFWILILCGLALAVSGCQRAASTRETTTEKSGVSFVNGSVNGNAPPIVYYPPYDTVNGLPGSGNPSATPAPTPVPVVLSETLKYQVQGIGNHPRHICVPARSKLKLRMMAHPNTDPLRPASNLYQFPDGTLVYDGSPAYYGRLRINMMLDGTSSGWDYLASNGNYSVSGDYSSLLGNVTVVGGNSGTAKSSVPLTSAYYINTTATSPSFSAPFVLNKKESSPFHVPDLAYVDRGSSAPQPTPAPIVGNDPSKILATPEYSFFWIFGSDPNDGLCTYWEKTIGVCKNISNAVLGSLDASCASGEKKILIQNIASDYPCNFDRGNWCKGGSLQYVPDLQKWSVTIEAVTEKTKDFAN